MEYRERKEVTPEAAVILWQASRLDLSEDYERAPEILKVHGSVIGTLGELQRINRKSKEQENVQCFRNRGGCTEKRDSAKLHGGTARKQEENTLCGYRTKFLPLCESGKKNIAHGGTADRQGTIKTLNSLS